MIQSEKIDVSEGINIDKTDKSLECKLCHYWYFKNIGFKFELHVCNKFHDVLVTAYELKNIEILNIKCVDYRCILWGVSKNNVINMLSNSVLKDKGAL